MSSRMRWHFMALLMLVACGVSEHEAPPHDAGVSSAGRSTAPAVTAPPEPPARAELPAGVGVVAPVTIKRVNPDYSKLSDVRAAGVPVVQVAISAKGDATDVRVLRAVHPRVDAAVVEAVRQWKFQPATRNGRPIPTYMTLSVHINWQ